MACRFFVLFLFFKVECRGVPFQGEKKKAILTMNASFFIIFVDFIFSSFFPLLKLKDSLLLFSLEFFLKINK